MFFEVEFESGYGRVSAAVVFVWVASVGCVLGQSVYVFAAADASWVAVCGLRVGCVHRLGRFCLLCGSV